MSLEIILIDDDALVCKIHERLLLHAGFTQTPRVFFDGQSALNHILQEDYTQKEYLIFLDLNMPIMDGWTFLHEIEKIEEARFQIFVVSSSFLVQDSQKALSFSNVERYIVKPLNLICLNEIKEQVEQNILEGTMGK